MKRLHSSLPLWLAIASLVFPLNAQSVSKLELEKSSALNLWEKVTITPDMVSSTGELLVPTSGSQEFYRMAVVVLELPTFVSQPISNTAIEEGDSATLSVNATGEGLSYQWYFGQSGDTSQPIDGATSSSYNTGALTADATYWVRVSNGAGGVNSALATVTVAAVTTPTDMELIPAGVFAMGDSLDGDSEAPPVTVNVSAFYMGKYEVTKALWDEVRTWGASNGYTDLAVGTGKAANHPVQTISWWDVVKWCNARSQKEGLTPVYTVNGAVMKTGTTEPEANWSVDGYRLPTEAEWEKAARGGLSGKRFPWGDMISHNEANFYNSSGESYQTGTTGLHPLWINNNDYESSTSPIGSFAANSYRLHDVTGNVMEMCWDWVGLYSDGTTDPRGATAGPGKAHRGGDCVSSAADCRVAVRDYDSPSYLGSGVGFRVARGSVAPTGFALIPAGAFTLGNSMAADTDLSGAPTRTVTLDAFYMGNYEVTKAEWDEVRTWGLSNGYTDLAAGSGEVSNPVHSINWYDMVKWCNARSQKEGLMPVYYTNDLQTMIYKIGDVNVTNAQVKWTANGHRLPTDAEWEKAARGGLSGKRFPWGDTISHSQANYYADSSYSYDLSGPVNNYHPTYNSTSPVGAFAANAYGLYDMAGNVAEWCWSLFGTYDEGNLTNPRGSTSGTNRVVRGGGYNDGANDCRVASRAGLDRDPAISNSGVGFRLARGSVAESAETAPAINTQPASTSINSGSTATLSVVASGTAPLTYQWYQGSVGTTTTPVGTSSASFTTPALTATTAYWVRVSNAAGGVNSALATVTVAAVTTPTGFALIPAGVFTMGDALDSDPQAPTRTVTVSAFYMAQNLVTKAQWDTVRTWATSNGYSDLAAGEGKASNHPVQMISWFDMVKWCNARSQQEGLTPVYYDNYAQVYKMGDLHLTNAHVKWTANGYRLPTEAEWEKAARGSLSGKRFPWGDTISQTQANYRATPYYSYDLSGAVNNYHPTYATGPEPYTSPVGSFAANGYGLNDMAGNVWQWCWDWYGTYATGSPTDPRGVSSGSYRVIRGGSWYYDAYYCRVANRVNGVPTNSYDVIGFRVARSSVP
jgi:sulfatase modifying factor 1